MFQVNKTGTILAACIVKRCWLLFDLNSYRCLREITTDEAAFRDMGSWFGALSNDGSRFAFCTYSNMKRPCGGEIELSAFVIWDTKNGKLINFTYRYYYE